MLARHRSRTNAELRSHSPHHHPGEWPSSTRGGDTKQRTRPLAAAALVGLGLSAAFVVGAFASPFVTGEPASGQPSVQWHPRAVTTDGKSAERLFGQVMAVLAATPPWHRSARSFSAAEVADLLGRPSSAAIAPTGRTTSLSIKPIGRPQICAEYCAPDHGWSLVFCS
jgi:hypothetical protein